MRRSQESPKPQLSSKSPKNQCGCCRGKYCMINLTSGSGESFEEELGVPRRGSNYQSRTNWTWIRSIERSRRGLCCGGWGRKMHVPHFFGDLETALADATSEQILLCPLRTPNHWGLSFPTEHSRHPGEPLSVIWLWEE